MTRLIVALALVLCSACASATSRARVQPADIQAELVQFHGAVAAQFQQGGMETEHFLEVTAWIGDALRVVQTNPSQWEGQARLRWPRVRSIVVPFEQLAPWGPRLDRVLQ
jgi:hypothetical protein